MNIPFFSNSELTQHISAVFAISVIGIVAYVVIFYFIRKLALKKEHVVSQLLQTYLYYPGLILIFIITLHIGLPFLRKHLTDEIYDLTGHLLHIALIINIGLLLSRGFSVFREVIFQNYKTSSPQDLALRKIRTQYKLLQRVMNVIIVIVTLSVVLMTFSPVRKFGTTLLASAGVVGIVLGFAAQKSLGTLFAGIQIAITQPIRLDDTVVVGKENGIISDITLTYVVIDTGDGRRLIFPINYFIDQSFENWSRNSPEITAKVKIYVDYTLPVQKVREEFNKWLAANELWDKRGSTFMATGADNKTFEITATMTARNPTDSNNLECFIREKLISHIQQNYPDSLPKFRLVEDKDKGNDKGNDNAQV